MPHAKPSTLVLLFKNIRFSHTVLALPFSLLGGLLAVRGFPPRPTGDWAWPETATYLWTLAAMVSARSAAMAFNRLADARLDRLNPRTQGRPIPSGRLKPSVCAAFTAVCALAFVLSAFQLNPLCAALSFPALGIILLYSLAKRFTILSHFILGFSLSIAAEGTWIAVTGEFSVPVMLLCAVIMTWVAGFDIFYACQDAEFDARHGLHSIPGRFGIPTARAAGRLLHLLTVVFMALFAIAFRLGWVAWLGMGGIATLLICGHAKWYLAKRTASEKGLFLLNGVISIGIFAFVALDAVLLSS